MEILRAHCYQYDLGGFSAKSYRRREIHAKHTFFEFYTFYQYDLGRVITFDRTASDVKKRPICSEELRSIDWKDKMTASLRSNTPGSGELIAGEG